VVRDGAGLVVVVLRALELGTGDDVGTVVERQEAARCQRVQQPGHDRPRLGGVADVVRHRGVDVEGFGHSSTLAEQHVHGGLWDPEGMMVRSRR
jgi:hypothetical protein